MACAYRKPNPLGSEASVIGQFGVLYVIDRKPVCSSVRWVGNPNWV